MQEIISGKIVVDGWNGLSIKNGYLTSGLADTFEAIVRKHNIAEIDYTDENQTILGKKSTIIPNCQIFIYYAKEETNIDALKLELMKRMEGFISYGAYLTGYSEYTICGLHIENLTIGGHDLVTEMLNHKGEYIYMILNF